ncbi:MAG: DUF2339 domain-containing protein [Bryobacteraceae bacterium]
MDTLIMFVAVLVLVWLSLPIIAIVRTRKIRKLELRLAGLEAALLRVMRQQAGAEPPVPIQSPAAELPPPTEPAPPAPTEAAPPAPPEVPRLPEPSPPSEHLETVVGRKWVGWIAVCLIFGAAAYFLKYAFENRWIGELGRVTLGLAGGLTFVWIGHDRYRKGWRYLSQILIGGGVAILYLSVYGAFGYYHLIQQRWAFVFLVVLVAESQLAALAYDAPSIGVMGLLGGFLVPLLFSTGRDNYRVLFTYIGVLDLGVLGVVVARRWRRIGWLAYLGTQGLFWAWYTEHYHPEKRLAALTFQSAIFLLFVLADLAPNLRRKAAGWEEWVRVVVNPFVFYATCYSLLNDDYHDWMAALALLLATLYAALARAEIALRPSDRRMVLVTVGTALTFVTLAIPVQLESNWITIAWGLEAVALLWAGFETAAPLLRWFSASVFSMALFRFLFMDTPWGTRSLFTPVFNRYFLGMLVLAACLAGAAHLCRRFGPTDNTRLRAALAIGLVAFAVLWLGSSVEAYSYFDSQADSIASRAVPDASETAKQLRWAGLLSLSILWSVYAGLLTAVGFRGQLRALRVAGLVLFGVTLVKVVFMDIAELQQFYRIVALLALGLVLLGVAWAYQRVLRREQTK